MNSLHSTSALARRTFLAVAALAALAGQAHAQAAWPARPLKLVVPFEPGGSNDILARVLATKLSVRLGQPVVVENKPGAGGAIGADFVAKAQADGYTLLLGSTSITTNTAVGKKLPFDPVKDLQPIGQIAASPFAIVVNKGLQVANLRELIELARSKPRSINYGSAGAGGTNHLGTEFFASSANVQLTHVAYKGIASAFTDLMSGTLQMLVPSMASAATHIHSGKLRVLAVTGAQRSALAPEIPTASEAGVPGFRLEVWFGLLGPARMPAHVVTRLNQELNAVLAQAEVRDLLKREGARAQPGTAEEFANLVRADLARWTQLVKERNIQVE